MGWRPCKCVPVPECREVTTDTCASEASIYVLTVSGMTNDDCTSCATWNGTFNLKYMGGNVWESDSHTTTACGHTNGDPLWRLHISNRSGTNYYELVAVGLGYTWSKTEATWTCNANNTLNRDSVVMVPNKCGTPSTLTVVPCTITCGLCTGSMPATVTVTVDGFGNNDCASCNALLTGTYVLPQSSPCLWEIYGTEECSYGYTFEYLIQVWIETDTIYVQFQIWWSPSGVGTGGYPWSSTFFLWTKTVTTPLDCSATRTGFTEQPNDYGVDSPCNATYPTLTLN